MPSPLASLAALLVVAASDEDVDLDEASLPLLLSPLLSGSCIDCTSSGALVRSNSNCRIEA